MCYQVVCLFDNSILIRPEDYVNLVIGSGASILISPHKDDFVTEIANVQHITLKGIEGCSAVEGIIMVTYHIPCPHKPDLKLQNQKSLHVPSCPS